MPTWQMRQLTKTVEIKFLAEFKELFNEQWRNIVFYGGRGSGKTQHVALALILRGRQSRLRILCTRELQNTIGDSVHKELRDIIDQYGLNDYEVTDKAIRNRLTGTEFIFAGLRHNATEIKSMSGVDIAWVEEAASISEASLKLLAPTIRKPGSQLIFTFNRMNELDPVYVRYVMNIPAKTYVRQVNYDVLERAGLLPDTLKLELEADRRDPDTFAHVWLGEPLAQAERAIIPRKAVLQAMQRTVDEEGAIEVGCDVARMGRDRITMYKRKGLKVIAQKIYSKLRTTETCDRLEEFVGYDKSVLLKIDDTGVGGGVTDEMLVRGYRVMPINFGSAAQDPDRYPNLISEAWFYLASIIDTVELPMDPELLMELSNRQWKMDTKGRRGVESKDDYKKRGYRSPDKADGIILCFYNSAMEFDVKLASEEDDDIDPPETSGLLDQRF